MSAMQSLEDYDLWFAAFQRDCKVSDLLDLALSDVGRYAASHDPGLVDSLPYAIEQVRSRQADRYETRAAAAELSVARQAESGT